MTNTSGGLSYKGFFDPHGQSLFEWSASGNTNLNAKKFTGYERDAATGLDYAEARTYAGNRGRFMQPDPAGLSAANLNIINRQIVLIHELLHILNNMNDHDLYNSLQKDKNGQLGANFSRAFNEARLTLPGASGPELESLALSLWIGQDCPRKQ